ncbi:F0F1 ATP synthase subunit epsilon [Marinomonas ostreistagni]|uniref:F0F1 ATP synthase subunit epsilon n=1 Tax=Marinomonas ostreistagni TaxID=359209 RepID=UPI0019516647|nr:F0F1 ATP synthase subunit epsilon [Marinomonas ostreistagni]MBM6550635.1 F0F1 ATP synthase subunit epsilon [Marinomonas ostreistagni]
MSRSIQCDIVSIDSTLFSNAVQHIVVTASQGDMGIYPGHAPLLAFLKPGIARLVKDDGSEEVLYISGGFLEVQPHKVTVLADFAERAGELDEEEALAAKQHAQEHLGDSSSDLDHARALKELNEAVARLRAIEMNRREGRFVDNN